MKHSNSKGSGYSIVIGIILIVLGLLVLSAQAFTTMFSILLVGWVLIIGGASQIILGIFSGAWSKFFLAMLVGLVNVTFGLILAVNPEISAATITLLIGILLLIGGVYKFLSALFVHKGRWGWVLTGGFISLILGASILAQWPYSGLWVIGLFIGIELIISGISFIVSAYEPELYYTTSQSHYLSGAKGGESEKAKE